MKNLFLVVLALCVYIPQANAQKVKDQEFRRVVVTLTSGEKVEGYVKRGWHAEASAFKKSNYSFKMTATPDDKEVLKYTADEVVCIDYTEKTENNPDGIRWESRELASPSIADRYRTIPPCMSGKYGRARFCVLVERLGCHNQSAGNETTLSYLSWNSFPR